MTWRMKIGEELGFNVNPVVGSFVKPDGWNFGKNLVSGDDWDLCQFRLPSCGGDLAVNIEITGTTLQRPFGGWNAEWVRVKVTFVADPGAWDWFNDCPAQDQVCRGWMVVTRNEKEWL